MTAPETTRPVGVRPRRGHRSWVPPQHGAWAMLLVPFLAGVGVSGRDWVQLPLLVAWLGGYLLSYYALLAVKTGRPGRVRAQLTTYAVLTFPAAGLVVLLRPRVLLLAPAFLVLVGINAWYSRRRSDRALTNGVVSAVGGSLGTLLATLAVPGAPVTASVWSAFGLLALYFIGTVFFVKTMIRERGQVGYLRLSVAWHTGATVVAWLVTWPFALLFGWLAARAAWLPHRRLSPARVGAIELVNSLVLLALTVGLLGR